MCASNVNNNFKPLYKETNKQGLSSHLFGKSSLTLKVIQIQ